MSQQLSSTLYVVSTWAIPLLIAYTFHEASHGYVARLCCDGTAWRLGRVSFNPFKHIDPFGTILLPALLVLIHSPCPAVHQSFDQHATNQGYRDGVDISGSWSAPNCR